MENNAALIQSEHADENKQEKKCGCLLSLPTIIFGLILFWPIGIILAIIRLIKTRDIPLRKNPVVFTLIIVHVMIFVASFAILLYGEYSSNKPFKDIEQYMAQQNYTMVQEILDNLISEGNTGSRTYLAYSKLWEAQGNYDEAATVLIQYYKLVSKEEILNPGIVNQLRQLKSLVSPERKSEIEDVFSSIEIAKKKAQSKAAEEEQRKIEAEAEAEANSKAAEEVQITADKEAESKAAEEARIKAEQEAASKAAEEERLKPVSTNFQSFDRQYRDLTTVQQQSVQQAYFGKYVEWTGEISEVYNDYIIISDGSAMCNVYLATNELDKLLTLSKGQYITVKGILTDVSGFFGVWEVKSAVIVK